MKQQPSLSLKLRFALLFASVATILQLAVGIVLHEACETHFVEQDQHDLERMLALVQHHLEQAGPQASPSLGGPMHGGHSLGVEIRRPDGTLLFANHAEALAKLPSSSPGLYTLKDGEHGPWRVLLTSLPGFGGEVPEQNFPVRIGIDISHHVEFMAMFRRVLAASLLIAALASGGLGWFAARRGLAPLRKLADHAANISASRLRERLLLSDTPPELAALSEAFNAMLARLEEAFHRLSHFSSDIAHELRTPVSNLLTQTEVALSRARSESEYRDVLHSNLEEFERLSRMIADMLFLAKADNGLIVPQCQRISLANEVRALFEFYDALAAERAVSLAVVGDGAVEGDGLMIRRALSNLLANALRHTAPGQSITVRIDGQDRWVAVEVENPGATIAPEHLPRLFDRFYRADPSRHKDDDASSSGSGLGLAITKSIVEAHGGNINVASDARSTRFRLVLPIAAPQTTAATVSPTSLG
jgi:two-component system, OmpR family, heavy metal sensor histidine kinase CusS